MYYKHNFNMYWETKKFMWLIFLRSSFYFGGLILNPWYLQGMPEICHWWMKYCIKVRSSVLMKMFTSSMSLLCVFLVDLSIFDRVILKSPTVIVVSCISPCSSSIFFASCFLMLLLGRYLCIFVELSPLSMCENEVAQSCLTLWPHGL